MPYVPFEDGDPLADIRAGLNATLSDVDLFYRWKLTNTIDLAGASGAEWAVVGDEVQVIGNDVDRSAAGDTRIQVSFDAGGVWQASAYRFAWVNAAVNGHALSENGVNVYAASTTPGFFNASFSACKISSFTPWEASRYIGTGGDLLMMRGFHATSGVVDRMRLAFTTGSGTFVAGSLQILQR